MVGMELNALIIMNFEANAGLNVLCASATAERQNKDRYCCKYYAVVRTYYYLIWSFLRNINERFINFMHLQFIQVERLDASELI